MISFKKHVESVTCADTLTYLHSAKRVRHISNPFKPDGSSSLGNVWVIYESKCSPTNLSPSVHTWSFPTEREQHIQLKRTSRRHGAWGLLATYKLVNSGCTVDVRIAGVQNTSSRGASYSYMLSNMKKYKPHRLSTSAHQRGDPALTVNEPHMLSNSYSHCNNEPNFLNTVVEYDSYSTKELEKMVYKRTST